jgi:ubiquitin-conjugating enzyme (huntingtin interacting protein 2)
VSLQALLSTPEPTDPQDAEVAGQYLHDQAGWVAKARYWTDTYAKADAPSDPKVDQLVDMGFALEDVRRALAAKAGNVEAAMELLLSGM